jgi:PAS domain S-box-containing protein
VPPSRPFGRRSSVAVLAVIAAAVAMLGLLVARTARQGSEAALMNAASRDQALSERVFAMAMAAHFGPPAQREVWRQRLATATSEWQASSNRLRAVPGGSSVVAPRLSAWTAFASLAPLQRDVLAAVATVRDASAPDAVDTLRARHHRYAREHARVLGALEAESAQQVDRLVQLEAVCVLLLVLALGVGLRMALHPTEEQLDATVAALAESESRNRAVLDAMVEGMLLTDAGGRVISWNPSAQRVLSFQNGKGPLPTLEQLLPMLVSPSQTPMALDELPSRVTMRTGKPVTDAILGVRESSGELRWLSCNTHPLFRGDSGEPHAAVAIFRDVTQARLLDEERASQAQALEMQNHELFVQADALERGQALFRSLVDTAGNAILGLDLEGRVFEWNLEAEAMFGVSRADAIGRDYATEFVPATHRVRMVAGINAVLGGEALRNHVGPVRGRNGERRTVLWNITPLRAADGPVHGLIAAGLDITEREASDERFRVLFERSSDAHLLLDDGGVIDCNDATLRLLRYDSKVSLLGRSPWQFSPHRQPDGRLSLVVSAQMLQHARDRGYHRFEWIHQRSDGDEFPVEVTLTPVRLNGREVILAVWHDIAEHKAVEHALRAAKDAAESANRTKSEFMTRMNHELRTPLTAIIGFSRVLLQGKQGVLSEGAQRYADRIRANGMHLLSLINQILDVAKVEAGRMDLDSDVVAVDVLVRETLAMVESTAEGKGIALRTELPPDMSTVVTDAGKLRQILINLVGNAIKFTEQGEVCVKVEVDPVTSRPVAISVRDTGIGIPLERQQKVFDPFEQGDSSTRREYGGTGLGLSIVKAFAELIGAAIEVESEVGVGTAFTIWLAPTDPVLAVPAPIGP